MAKQRRQGARSRRRKKEGPMPMGGAGLIRFFQDSSSGIKIGPYATLAISAGLILFVILAHTGALSWLFQI